MERDWAGLPWGLIVELSRAVDNRADYVRFRSVCDSWRKAAPPKRQYPCLLTDPDTNGRLYVYELPNFSFVNHRLPEGEIQGSIRGRSAGWVVWVASGYPALLSEVSLVNPFTGAHVRLPEVPFHPDIDIAGRIQWKMIALSSDPMAAPDSCIAMVLFDPTPNPDLPGSPLYFCRLGDNAWTAYPGFSSEIDDIIFYKGHFYAVDNRSIFRCEIGPAAEAVEITAPQDTWTVGTNYLAGSSGDLLLVRIIKTESSTETDMEVYRVDLSTMPGNLVKLNDLGGYKMFLNRMRRPICARGIAQNRMYNVTSDKKIHVLGVEDGNITLISELREFIHTQFADDVWDNRWWILPFLC